MSATKTHTADELLHMGKDAPYVLIRGKLRTARPSGMRAAWTAGRAAFALFRYADQEKSGIAVGPNTGFILARDPDTVLAPKAAFVYRNRLPSDMDWDHYFPVPPDLAVEVLSPSNRPRQVAEKLELYLEAGVRLLWVVDPRRRIVTTHGPNREPRVIDVNGELDGEDILPGFRLAVAELFRIP